MQNIGIAKLIDATRPNQSKCKCTSHGQLMEAMISNGLDFVGRTLHIYPEYFPELHVKHPLGKGIKAMNTDIQHDLHVK